MKMLFFLQAQAGQQSGGGMGSFLIMRPQQKKQKELVKFRDSLQKGDKVVTIGGIYGTVAEIKERVVLLEVDNNVKIRVDKSSLVKDISDVPAK